MSLRLNHLSETSRKVYRNSIRIIVEHRGENRSFIHQWADNPPGSRVTFTVPFYSSEAEIFWSQSSWIWASAQPLTPHRHLLSEQEEGGLPDLWHSLLATLLGHHYSKVENCSSWCQHCSNASLAGWAVLALSPHGSALSLGKFQSKHIIQQVESQHFQALSGEMMRCFL